MDQVPTGQLPQKPNLPFAQIPQGAVPPPPLVPEPVLETAAPSSPSVPSQEQEPLVVPQMPPAATEERPPIPSAAPPAPPSDFSPPSSPLPSTEGMIVPQPKTKPKGVGVKNLVLVVALVIMLGGLVAGFGKVRSFLTNAQGGCDPEGLTEANLTANSIEIVFQTGKACQMEVAYGTSSEALLLQVPEAMASINHRIRLAPLLASTTYYYQVVSEGKKVGQVRSFLTKAPDVTPPPVSVEEPGEEVNPVVQPSETLPEEPVPTPSSIAEEAAVDSSASAAEKYTIEDFQSQFGGDNPVFDLDKNGVVNMRDWLMYQKQ
jgi:hypothetical protein